jgi:hypothetical protein
MRSRNKSNSRRSQAARANGAKSRGPATPAGRARSSRNSLRHGLASRAAALPPVSVVLPAESAADFQRLLDSYLDEFAPTGPLEVELVETMAAATWRLRRLSDIETTLLGNEIAHAARYVENEFENDDREPDASDRLAYAFKHLSHSPSLGLLIRYEGVLSRSFGRAFKQLQMLQAARTRAQPNEPKLPKSQIKTAAPVRPLAPPAGLETCPESLQNSALPFQRATIQVPPGINDQHLHP